VYDTNEVSMNLCHPPVPMTETEIGDIMDMPFSELLKFCRKDEEQLRTVLSLAIKSGIAEGRRRSALNMNKVLRTGLYLDDNFAS